MIKVTGTIELPQLRGVEVSPGVFLLGEPTPVEGTALMRCLADVGGALAVVELRVSFGRESNKA